MDELYEYLKGKIAEVGWEQTSIGIDLPHAFRLYQMICFLKQIRGICLQEDVMWNTLRKVKEGQ